MVDVIFLDKFKKTFSKIKDSLLKERIIKQIEKIKINPEVVKPIKNIRKGTRKLYIKLFKLSYEYFKDKNLVYILEFYHKDEQ